MSSNQNFVVGFHVFDTHPIDSYHDKYTILGRISQCNFPISIMGLWHLTYLARPMTLNFFHIIWSLRCPILNSQNQAPRRPEMILTPNILAQLFILHSNSII